MENREISTFPRLLMWVMLVKGGFADKFSMTPGAVTPMGLCHTFRKTKRRVVPTRSNWDLDFFFLKPNHTKSRKVSQKLLKNAKTILKNHVETHLYLELHKKARPASPSLDPVTCFRPGSPVTDADRRISYWA